MLKTRLELEFLDRAEKKFILRLDQPRPDLSQVEVKEAMNNILTNNIFENKGTSLQTASSARIVSTQVNEIEVN